MTAVTVSELSMADPWFATLFSIRARQETIKREWEYASRAPVRVNANRKFAQAARDALLNLSALEDRLVNLPCKNHTPDALSHESSLRAQLRDRASDRRVDAQRDATQFKEIRRLFRNCGTSTAQKAEIFGLPTSDRRSSANELWVHKLMEKLQEKGSKARMAEHQWRMKEEIELRASQGWYIVFNTLTVSPQNYDRVFERGSLAWRFFIREIDRAVGTKVYGSVRKAVAGSKKDPIHTYCGIVERGSHHGRLHIHVVHCLKDMPDEWKKDPNVSVDIPKRRKITGLERLWQYGFSDPIACRFSDYDAFGELGWRWPVKKIDEKYKPIMAKPPLAMARYMCKYLMKSYSSDKGGYQWRTRSNNGWGLTKLRQVLQSIPSKKLETYLEKENLRMRVNEETIPTSRLRLEMLKRVLKPTRSGLPESGSNLLHMQTLRKSLTEVTPRPPFVERMRSLMKTRTACNLASTIPSVAPIMNDTDVFDVKRSFSEAYERPRNRYPARAGTCTRREI